MRRSNLAHAFVLAGLVGGCGSESTPSTPPPTEPAEYKLGGNVNGLEGTGLELTAGFAGGLFSTVKVAKNGSFTFLPTLKDGATYDVKVATMPSDPAQNCLLVGGSGVVAGADVTDLVVDCTTLPPALRAIGGMVMGLHGAGLVLQNNASDDLAITTDGVFQFATKMEDGKGYDVTVAAQPQNPAQTCAVMAGNGLVDGADITGVMISCVDDPLPPPKYLIGGTVTGLKGPGLVLQNNAGDDLMVDQDGAFAFSMPLQEGQAYDVSVAAAPTSPAQSCWVTAGAGVVTNADVTSVVVKCSVDPKTVDVTNGDRCDFLDPAHCLYPFPNDYFTVADAATSSGRRIAFDPASMPVNEMVDLSIALGAPPGTLVSPGGVAIDPKEWNRNDGYSPGQMALTFVPGLDPVLSGIGPITDMGRSLEAESPLVVIDADTGERHLVWGEMDMYETTEAQRSLIIHAGVNYREGHRYIVALRNLKDNTGATLEPGAAFTVYRDAVPSDIPEIEARRAHFEELFGKLAEASIERKELYIAWDFTVASRKNLSERMLHVRDDAFAALGNNAPAFTVTKVTQNPDANRSRRIEGTFTVPNYLNQANGVSGSAFNYAQPDDGLPDVLGGNGTLQANFICNIPRSAMADGNDGAAPVVAGRPALYGHGQQGSASQVNGGSATGELSNLYNFVFCATDFIGMASSDDLNILQMVVDWTRIKTLADRLQQGLLNNLYLARLLVHPQGFVSDPNFRGGPAAAPLIDTSEVFYYGISQGGILGGALVAISQDIRRGAFGVTGMNYSLLLDRATGFDDLRPFMDQAYPSEYDRRILFSAVQMLWDRGESNGYAWHMTNDPLPNTPPHAVLMQDAFADHQVTQWSADIEARTIGASIHTPTLLPNRSIDKAPFLGIPAIESYPFFGSAAFVWDTGPYNAATNTGTPPPPVENQPLRVGADPHSRPRVQAGARLQISEFLKSNGKVIDSCAGAACQAL